MVEIVKKIIKSLPKRFRPKVIDEIKNLGAIKIEELVGYLQKYELSLLRPKNNNPLALKLLRKLIVTSLMIQI